MSKDIYKILTLDGGGVKAIIQGVTLKSLPTINYDLIAGTSGGAINAALLAMGHTPDDIVKFYAGPEDKQVFKPYLLPFHESKYNPQNVEEVMLEIFVDIKLGDLKQNILIHSYNISERKAVLFSNLNNEHKGLYLRDIVLASAAAPYYFTPHIINGEYYTDGGLVANNPTMCAYSFVREKFNTSDVLVVSIGTGSFELPVPYKHFVNTDPMSFLPVLIDCFMDGNQEGVQVEAQNMLGDNYIRFQLNLDASNSDIDNTSDSNMQNLINLTNSYVNNDWKKLIDVLKTRIN